MTEAQGTAAGATESPVVSAVRARFGDAVGSASVNRGQWRVAVTREALRDVARFVAEDPASGFAFPVDVTAVDHHPDEPRFRVVYVLRSMARREELVLEVRVPEDDCWAPTLSDVFPAFDKIEREAYDMFGIVFRGHADLRRIMMPAMFQDWPLRKDFPMEGRMSDREWAEWIIARAQRLEGEGA